MKSIRTSLIAILAALGTASAAQATVIVYDLSDTTHSGGLVGGFDQYLGNGVFQTLSFERNGADAKLYYDTVGGTLRIAGTGYNVTTDDLTAFDVLFDQLDVAGTSINGVDMDAVGVFGGSEVLGKGLNLSLVGDSVAADGWLSTPDDHFGDFHFAGVKVDEIPAGGSTSGGGTTSGSDSGSGGGAIPAPAPLGLIFAAGLFALWRRKRAVAG